jgi:hypothetical protein
VRSSSIGTSTDVRWLSGGHRPPASAAGESFLKEIGREAIMATNDLPTSTSVSALTAGDYLSGLVFTADERDLLLEADRLPEDEFRHPSGELRENLADAVPARRIAVLKASRRLEDLGLVQDPTTLGGRQRGRLYLTALGRDVVAARHDHLTAGDAIT